MKKIMEYILLIIITLLLCAAVSGCSDSLDINEKRILTAVALDKKDGEIYIYVEIANIEGGNKSEVASGSSGRKYIHIKSHGKTIPEARENLNRQLNKEIYLSAVRTLILTENFAKEEIVEYLYRLRANELYRKKAITVITREDPKKLFDVNNQKDVSVGFSIEEMLKTLEDDGESFSRTTSRLLENLSTTYTGFLIPCIGLQDGGNSLVGYSVVNGTTINGFIPVEESKGTIYIKTDKPKFYYVIPYKDNKFTVDVSLKKKKIKPSYENGKINYDMKFDFEAKLMYGNEKTPYNFDETSNVEVSEIITDMLKKQLVDAVELSQKKFKCDYLQFDDEFRVKFPVEFDNMDWGSEFLNASFNIDVNVSLSNTWMMDYETNVSR